VTFVRRQCERPGCGAAVGAHWGIDAGRLLVWIDNRALAQREQAGSLCRRHADALTVPRGWTLEDRRDEHPVLFRVPEQTAPVPPSVERLARRRPVQHIATAPSLFDVDSAASGSMDFDRDVPAPVPPHPVPSDPAPSEAGSESPEPVNIEDAETVAMPWSPRLTGRADGIFDGSDGVPRPVLGRLLGRAFRADDDDLAAEKEAG